MPDHVRSNKCNQKQSKNSQFTSNSFNLGDPGISQSVTTGNAAALDLLNTSASQPQLTGANSGIVQMIRKRVKGNSPKAQADNIFYDKEDGKYYKNMVEGAKVSKKLKANEALLYDGMKDKDRSPHTILAAEAEDGSFVRTPKASIGSEKHEGNILTAENAEAVDDTIAVRLYAEGNFDHANVLAETMPEGREFNKLQELDGDKDDERKKSEAAPVLIKGTEFDKRSDVLKRYDKGRWRNMDTSAYGKDDAYTIGYDDGWYDKKDGYSKNKFPGKDGYERAYNRGYDSGYSDTYDWDTREIEGKIHSAQSKPNLELSFSGKTGDLTRTSVDKVRPVRQYDLIQSTFFWLPGAKSSVVEAELIKFFTNQYRKVKDGGLIRVVLTNRNNPTTPSRDENQYRRTADNIIAQLNADPFKYMYASRLIELSGIQGNKTYSKTLEEEGLNPNEAFKHTMTDAPKEVGALGGDLIIQARKMTEIDIAGLKMSEWVEDFGK